MTKVEWLISRDEGPYEIVATDEIGAEGWVAFPYDRVEVRESDVIGARFLDLPKRLDEARIDEFFQL